MAGKIKEYLNKLKELNSTWKTEPRSGELHSVSVLFDTPDGIIHAAHETANAGYKKFDVFTPYPVHSMDDAMKMRESKIGWVALAAGFTGTITALLMIGWMSGIDYKNIIGGKPFFAIPPAIPITFELTVLFSAVVTTLAMIALFNKLPYLSNPLHETAFMKSVTSDKFGLVILADDKNFKEENIENFYRELDGHSIEKIYFPINDKGKTKALILDYKFVALLVVVAVLTAGISYLVLNTVLYSQPFSWMWNQPKLIAQSKTDFFPDGYGMRMPVEGTVARGFIPYEYKGMPDSLIKLLANPLPVSEEVIARGKTKFDTFCSPCHGYYAKGDSRLKGLFPNPPSLHTDKVRNWPDGNIYNVITNGQNVMPSYEKSVSRDDRWAIIHYIRVLQRSQNAKDSDLEGK
jgi:mono/diheme cytochrome c family protein